MKRDTVVLSLHDYNDLRDFKSNLEKKRFGVIGVTGWNSYIYLDDDEVYKNLNDTINSLHKQIKELKEPKTQVKEVTIDDIKKLSIIKLIKWRLKK